jgi:hypothetical protein
MSRLLTMSGRGKTSLAALAAVLAALALASPASARIALLHRRR